MNQLLGTGDITVNQLCSSETVQLRRTCREVRLKTKEREGREKKKE